jgi:hypothetical protein
MPDSVDVFDLIKNNKSFMIDKLSDNFITLHTTSLRSDSETIRLKRFWPINKQIINFVGLIESDGYSIGTRRKGISFKNTNSSLVKLVLNSLLKLGVPKFKIRAHLSFSKYYVPSYNSLLDDWSQKLKFNKNQFWKPYITFDKGKDRCGLCYYNKVFRVILDRFRLIVRDLLKKNIKISAWYLQGIVAGESTFGNNEIHIAYNQITDPIETWILALKNIGIKRLKTDKVRIKFSGMDNFAIAYNQNLFGLDKNKKCQFLKSLRQTKLSILFNESLRNNIYKDIKNQRLLAEKLNITTRRAHTYVKGICGIPVQLIPKIFSMFPTQNINHFEYVNKIFCGAHTYKPSFELLNFIESFYGDVNDKHN